MDCTPYRCADGACINRCASDNDCAAGTGVPERKLRQEVERPALRGRGDCASNHCIDAVCCDQACAGACRSCALPTSLGSCRPVPNGDDDPRNMCVTQPASTCGTDGKCDGAGGCRRYRPGTVCAARALRQQQIHTRVHLQHDRDVCRARRHLVRPVRLQRQQVLRGVHPRRELLSGQRVRRQLVRLEAARRVLLGPAASACRATARRAFAAPPPARARAGRARCRARWAPARTSP